MCSPLLSAQTEESRAVAGLAALIFAGQEAARQGAIRQHAKPLINTQILEFTLELSSMGQVVMRLERIIACQLEPFTAAERHRQPPGRNV